MDKEPRAKLQTKSRINVENTCNVLSLIRFKLLYNSLFKIQYSDFKVTILIPILLKTKNILIYFLNFYRQMFKTHDDVFIILSFYFNFTCLVINKFAILVFLYISLSRQT